MAQRRMIVTTFDVLVTDEQAQMGRNELVENLTGLIPNDTEIYNVTEAVEVVNDAGERELQCGSCDSNEFRHDEWDSHWWYQRSNEDGQLTYDGMFDWGGDGFAVRNTCTNCDTVNVMPTGWVIEFV